jgi:glyoxylase-like metal-dependent hydrolase (beta-lactamase superfamily II)
MLEFQLVTDHIARLEIPIRVAELIPTSVAVWLVGSPEGYVLIDSGPQNHAGEMVEAVSKATGGRGPKIVMLTHAHHNHAGGLTALRLAWNPPIVAHPQEIPYIRGERDYSRLRSRNPAYWIGSLLMDDSRLSIPNVQGIKQDRSLFGLTVIHLPGHTPGHLGFIHHQDHACICGDSAMRIGRRLSGPFIFTTHHPKMARQSLLRLSERNFNHLLPSHGLPLMKTGRKSLFEYAQKSKKRRKPPR